MTFVLLTATAVVCVGLGVAIGGLLGHVRAERILVKSIKTQSELRRQLEEIRVYFDSSNPDPANVAVARRLLATAAGELSDRQRKDILSTLEQGSDRSKANYIAKLLDEVAS